MTYLSHIPINPLRAESRDLLACPRAMRGAVLGGISDPSEMKRVLWRLDADDPQRPLLFVLSPSRPDWTRLVEAAGWPGAAGDQAATREYRPLLTRLTINRKFAFRVTASPVRDDPGESQAPDDDRAHLSPAQQLGWFLEHAPTWGFAIPRTRTGSATSGLDGCSPRSAPDVRITARSRRSFTESGRGVPVTLHTATFEGRLLVTDVVLLTQAILKGIGPNKAYGCGLFTLTHPHSEDFYSGGALIEAGASA
ncbi:type I-E CRISPR-associated protein Cas6/Cse3/CasE [Spirillospora sp. NPDC048823]|uniref:type I-E CRISPR-associated protein Cas6/Cse3/CasE n=1 Tax=unclassified Spirillospora TaxID=2642701 RepID=UPI003710149B